MMRSRLIVDGGLRRTESGFDCTIRLPWYRALPLSTIDLPTVAIDGQALPASAVTLEVDGKTYDVESIREATDHWWYVLDSAVLHVAAPYPDGKHDLSIEVPFAPPYIPEITLFCAATKSLAAA